MSDMLVLAAALDRHTKALETCAAALASAPTTKAAKAPKAAAETASAEATVSASVLAASTPAVAPSAAPAAVPAAATAPVASAASAAAGTGPNLQQVADAIIDLANTVSREAAVEILTKYGAQKVPQIRSQDFAAVLADVKAKKSPPSAGAGLM